MLEVPLEEHQEVHLQCLQICKIYLILLCSHLHHNNQVQQEQLMVLLNLKISQIKVVINLTQMVARIIRLTNNKDKQIK